jgi:molybdate transport system substrate-binding protein
MRIVEDVRTAPGLDLAGRRPPAPRGRGPRLIAALVLTAIASASAQGGELRVFAAGSLRAALTEIAQAYERNEPGTRVVLTFGASGLLKDRIAAGEPADVFASANMEHPEALAATGRAGRVQRFARNAMCVLAAPTVDASPDNLVDRLLDPAIKVGTSTPKADPSGDYAWMVFERIEQHGRRGAFKQLTGKALPLTGGPQSPPPRPGRNVYADLVAQGHADLFVTYCTNATLARAEQPSLRSVPIPAAFNVSADYGVAPMQGAAESAQRFIRFLLSPPAQDVLARSGFSPP